MEKLDTDLEALSLMASPLSECSEVLRMLPGKKRESLFLPNCESYNNG